MKPCVLFAGNSSIKLANEIVAASMSIQLGNVYHHQFPSGEWYCQLKENVRGTDVFLIQSGHSPANDNLMQLLVMIDAARRASAGRITAVLPFYGYSRQDRKDKPRVPISAKLVANLLVAAGVNRILTMDLHAQQIQGFFDIPVDHLYFQPTLMKAMEKFNIQVIVAPDQGAIKKAVDFSTPAKLPFAFIVKLRKNDTDVEIVQFIGEVKGKNVLVLDDLTESAGTIEAAVKCCHKNGAANVYAAVSHAAMTMVGSQRLQELHESGVLTQFFCSNTVTGDWQGNDWGTVVSVADTFSKAIQKIHNNESVTELFQ